jgi:predicted acetylornithine/succinylornithine family transaminase
MTTYARFGVTFVRGEGAYLFDANGKRYLDLLSGIAVCSVGHCHPYMTRAFAGAGGDALHVSNLYLTEPQARLARRLIELSDFERVFFCNSGAEANEAALKIARKRGRGIRESKTNIITAKNSFHGRTIATVTATGQPKYSEAFAPLPGGFSYVPFNDIDALREAVTDDTAAIMIEPIQGEGGIIPATAEYVQAARELADKHDALLIFDEVQTGVGRTGTLWAYQGLGVVPDVMTLAKGLGGGVPIGACLARGRRRRRWFRAIRDDVRGNPLATAAANAVLDILADEELTANARETGAYLQGRTRRTGGNVPADRRRGARQGLDDRDRATSAGGESDRQTRPARTRPGHQRDRRHNDPAPAPAHTDESRGGRSRFATQTGYCGVAMIRVSSWASRESHPSWSAPF